jgi:hypothetical protein
MRWHTVRHGRGSEGENRRMQWVASTLHTTSEHGVSSITTADGAHLGCASSRLNWRPAHRADLNGLVRLARKTKSGFCACAITFQLGCTPRRVRERTQTPLCVLSAGDYHSRQAEHGRPCWYSDIIDRNKPYLLNSIILVALYRTAHNSSNELKFNLLGAMIKTILEPHLTINWGR